MIGVDWDDSATVPTGFTIPGNAQGQSDSLAKGMKGAAKSGHQSGEILLFPSLTVFFFFSLADDPGDIPGRD